VAAPPPQQRRAVALLRFPAECPPGSFPVPAVGASSAVLPRPHASPRLSGRAQPGLPPCSLGHRSVRRGGARTPRAAPPPSALSTHDSHDVSRSNGEHHTTITAIVPRERPDNSTARQSRQTRTGTGTQGSPPGATAVGSGGVCVCVGGGGGSVQCAPCPAGAAAVCCAGLACRAGAVGGACGGVAVLVPCQTINRGATRASAPCPPPPAPAQAQAPRDAAAAVATGPQLHRRVGSAMAAATRALLRATAAGRRGLATAAAPPARFKPAVASGLSGFRQDPIQLGNQFDNDTVLQSILRRVGLPRAAGATVSEAWLSRAAAALVRPPSLAPAAGGLRRRHAGPQPLWQQRRRRAAALGRRRRGQPAAAGAVRCLWPPRGPPVDARGLAQAVRSVRPGGPGGHRVRAGVRPAQSAVPDRKGAALLGRRGTRCRVRELTPRWAGGHRHVAGAARAAAVPVHAVHSRLRLPAGHDRWRRAPDRGDQGRVPAECVPCAASTPARCAAADAGDGARPWTGMGARDVQRKRTRA